MHINIHVLLHQKYFEGTSVVWFWLQSDLLKLNILGSIIAVPISVKSLLSACNPVEEMDLVQKHLALPWENPLLFYTFSSPCATVYVFWPYEWLSLFLLLVMAATTHASHCTCSPPQQILSILSYLKATLQLGAEVRTWTYSICFQHKAYCSCRSSFSGS